MWLSMGLVHWWHYCTPNVTCWSCRKTNNSCISDSLRRSMLCSNRSRSLSVLTCWQWCKTNCTRLVSSRFSILSRFTWFLRFSKCLCLRMRDLLADSRFDIMRLCFRSSTRAAGGFGSSEPEFELVTFRFRFGSSELELETTGFGVTAENRSQSHGVKPFSKAWKGFPMAGSDENIAGIADNMGQKFLLLNGGRREGEREDMQRSGFIFMDEMWGLRDD